VAGIIEAPGEGIIEGMVEGIIEAAGEGLDEGIVETEALAMQPVIRVPAARATRVERSIFIERFLSW
jgi:hypothetical protein